MNLEIEDQQTCRCESRLILSGISGRETIEVICLENQGHKGDHRFCKQVQSGDGCDWLQAVVVEVTWHRSTRPEKRTYRKQIGVCWEYVGDNALAEGKEVASTSTPTTANCTKPDGEPAE